jgi:hypothetical protein
MPLDLSNGDIYYKNKTICELFYWCEFNQKNHSSTTASKIETNTDLNAS